MSMSLFPMINGFVIDGDYHENKEYKTANIHEKISLSHGWKR